MDGITEMRSICIIVTEKGRCESMFNTQQVVETPGGWGEERVTGAQHKHRRVHLPAFMLRRLRFVADVWMCIF